MSLQAFSAKQSPRVERPKGSCYSSGMLCAQAFGTVQK